MAIEDGVALVRLSGTGHGCGGHVEEFYVVMTDGHMLERRYKSYGEAFKHCERLYREAHVDVA